MNQETTVITLRDLEEARERGMLSGEVRILKWGTIAAITVIFLFLTYLAQQINEVRSDLTRQINEVRSDLTQQINEVRSDLTRQINEVRSDLTRQINEVRKEMKQGQIAIHERLTSVEQQLGLRSTSTEPASPAVADEQANTDITGRAAKPDKNG